MERQQLLTIEQRVFVVKKYYETSNKSETCLFKEQFDRVTKWRTVSNIVERFEETGSFDELPRSGRPTTVCSPENARVVQAVYAEGPTKSTRRSSLELRISRTSIHRMLHSLELHPYRPHLVYAMSKDDPDRRTEFCETFINKCDHVLRFAEKILWSHEATFKMNSHMSIDTMQFTGTHKILASKLNPTSVSKVPQCGLLVVRRNCWSLLFWPDCY